MWYKVRVADPSAKARRRRWVGYHRKCPGVMRPADLNDVRDQRVTGLGLITLLGEDPRRVDFNPDVAVTIRLDNVCHYVVQDSRKKQTNAWASISFDNVSLSLGMGVVHPRLDRSRAGREMRRFRGVHGDEIWVCLGIDAIFECRDANQPYSSLGIGNYGVSFTAFCNKGAVGSMWLRNPKRVVDANG